MASIYSPAHEGFDSVFDARDRVQVGLLRELAGRQGSRLILKGGMAMRAAFGSTRLTKDIDFDAQPEFELPSGKTMLKSALTRAAQSTGLRSIDVDFPKATSTTVRARLRGVLQSGQPVRFVVEVSCREGSSSGELLRSVTVAPPSAYGMAPFVVQTYTNDALAATKIAAALAQSRNAPRDLYDLGDLFDAGADPSGILARQSSRQIANWRDDALKKLELLTFDLARDELLPYLPVRERERFQGESAWIDLTLSVAERIVETCNKALAFQAQKNVAQEAAPVCAPGSA